MLSRKSLRKTWAVFGVTTLVVALFSYCAVLNKHLNEGLSKPRTIIEYEDSRKGHALISRELADFLPLESNPKQLVQAVIAAEGRDIPYVLARSLTRHVRPGRNLEFHLSGILYPLILKLKLSYSEMLEFYINRVYMGSGQKGDIFGLEEGAMFYFGKKLDHLNLAESAFLAGLIRGPSYYPQHLTVARDRQKRVLENMVDAGYITPGESLKAQSTPINLR